MGRTEGSPKGRGEAPARRRRYAANKQTSKQAIADHRRAVQHSDPTALLPRLRVRVRVRVCLPLLACARVRAPFRSHNTAATAATAALRALLLVHGCRVAAVRRCAAHSLTYTSPSAVSAAEYPAPAAICTARTAAPNSRTGSRTTNAGAAGAAQSCSTALVRNRSEPIGWCCESRARAGGGGEGRMRGSWRAALQRLCTVGGGEGLTFRAFTRPAVRAATTIQRARVCVSASARA
jgi:hypothetical protein